jgi:hypothetical protein
MNSIHTHPVLSTLDVPPNEDMKNLSLRITWKIILMEITMTCTEPQKPSHKCQRSRFASENFTH